ncbi:hypothetical protein AAXE64_27290 [Priestia megaterium]
MRTQEDIWITGVDIKNFQSHINTSLTFTRGTNALIGSSNSGKTAVLRAIKWCLRNYPKGTDFIRAGQKEASVTTHLSNGKSIERVRGKGSVNFYRLHVDGELKEEYTGFGSNVPPDIEEAHGIKPIAGDIYFQFADQLEAPFLLSLKPSKRAEVLGNLEELGKVDKALTSVNEDLRLNAKEKKRLEKEGKEIELEKKSTEVIVERLAEKVTVLKKLKTGIETKTHLQTFLHKQLDRLKEIREVIGELNETILQADTIIHHWPEDLEERNRQFEYIQKRMQRLIDIKEELAEIQDMKDDILFTLEESKNDIEQRVKNFRSLSDKLEALKRNQELQENAANDYSERVAAINYSQLDVDVSKYKVLFNHLDRLQNVGSQIKETDSLIENANESIDAALNQFVEALQEAEICPTCGQETHEVCTKTLETII